MNNNVISYPAEFNEFDSNNIGKTAFNPVVIVAENSKQLNGYVIPDLTADDIVKAYNAVVSGTMCVITDKSGLVHLIVNQADIVGADLCIEVSYFGSRVITYMVDGDNVSAEMSGVMKKISSVAPGKSLLGSDFNVLLAAFVDAGLMEN